MTAYIDRARQLAGDDQPSLRVRPRSRFEPLPPNSDEPWETAGHDSRPPAGGTLDVPRGGTAPGGFARADGDDAAGRRGVDWPDEPSPAGIDPADRSGTDPAGRTGAAFRRFRPAPFPGLRGGDDRSGQRREGELSDRDGGGLGGRPDWRLAEQRLAESAGPGGDETGARAPLPRLGDSPLTDAQPGAGVSGPGPAGTGMAGAGHVDAGHTSAGHADAGLIGAELAGSFRGSAAGRADRTDVSGEPGSGSDPHRGLVPVRPGRAGAAATGLDPTATVTPYHLDLVVAEGDGARPAGERAAASPSRQHLAGQHQADPAGGASLPDEVTVTIGRVEVRVGPPAGQPSAAAPADRGTRADRARPRGLEDYLRARASGRVG